MTYDTIGALTREADMHLAHAKEYLTQRDKLAVAIIEILKANDEFRAGMPEGWEGDPLQDACEAARKLVVDSVVGNSLPPADGKTP